MPRISVDNYDTVASWNGSQDLFIVEQPDGTKVATPNMVRQFMESFYDEVPTEGSNNPVKSGGVYSTAVASSKSTTNNITISRMGKVRVLTFNRAIYSDIKTFFSDLSSNDKPSNVQFSTAMRTSSDHKYMTLAFIYISALGLIEVRHFASYNANATESEVGTTDRVIGEIVYIVD